MLVEKCGIFIPAKPIGDVHPGFDPRSGAAIPKCFVKLLRANIGADGLVHDAVLLNVTGPSHYAEFGTDAVKRWTYQPATLDGKPGVLIGAVDFQSRRTVHAARCRKV